MLYFDRSYLELTVYQENDQPITRLRYTYLKSVIRPVVNSQVALEPKNYNLQSKGFQLLFIINWHVL